MNGKWSRGPANRLIIILMLGLCSLAGCRAPEDEGNATAHAAESAEFLQHHASSDQNFVKALLFRWWGIFEAPKDVERSAHFEDLFTEDVYLAMPGVELRGREAIITGFSNLPPDSGRSHQLESVSVNALSEKRFQLNARFTYQIARPNGSIEAGHSSYQHEAIKQPDGQFLLAKLTAELGDPVVVRRFEPSYLKNRARGTLAQYLAITDLLDSDYRMLSQVMNADSEIHGMFDPQQESHNSRGDGTLKGLTEITAWLAKRRGKFEWVSHSIATVDVVPLAAQTYQVTSQIAVAAKPKDAAVIEVMLPIVLTMHDQNERFMRIEKIQR